MSNITHIEVLKQGRSLVETGWIQSFFKHIGNDNIPCYCSVGAMRQGATGTIYDLPRLPVHDAVDQATAALYNVIPESFKTYESHHEPNDARRLAVFDWNDHEARTKQEVLAAFDAAIAAEEAKQ